MSGNFNHSIKRLGRQSGPVTVSIEPLLNIVSVGNSVSYNLNSQQTSTGSISYVLNPSIQFGDQIKYILKTDNGLWVKKDTIVKTFGAMTLQALEDATAITNWTGNWSTTTTTFVSPSKSFFDGSANNYVNNTNKTYAYVPTINLTQATSAMISFYAKWGIESDYDFVQFQVSTDGGSTWIGQCGNYTVPGTSANGSVQPNNQPVYEGTQSTWVLEEINLSDYLGQQIKVRFQLRSDGGTNADGYYFDDFKVLFNENTSTAAPVASFTASSNSVCVGNSISFTDFSTNTPTSWSWNFGDGTTSNTPNPTHVFDVSGTYTVDLTVTNATGSNTITQSIVVNQNPVVTISTNDSDNTVCSNAGLVQLIPTPATALLSGTGVVGSTFDPSIAGVGVSIISANYTDANGCQGSSQVSITVDQCASIEDQLLAEILIVPNPNNAVFQIVGLPIGVETEIRDINGRVIYSFRAKQEVEQVSISEIANGVYYLRIQNDLKWLQKRFIVLK
jgi:PKD repeat protein